MPSDTAPRSGRRGAGRDAKRAARLAHAIDSVPFITRQLAPFEVLSEEGLALIEHNADTVLEEIGIDFKGDPEALDLWRAAGADGAVLKAGVPVTLELRARIDFNIPRLRTLTVMMQEPGDPAFKPLPVDRIKPLEAR